MTKVHYSSEVAVRDGKIRRAIPVGIEHATKEQVAVINQVKPVMNFWLRSRIAHMPRLENSMIFMRSKITETANGLSIDFKIQGVSIEGSTEHSEQPSVETEP